HRGRAPASASNRCRVRPPASPTIWPYRELAETITGAPDGTEAAAVGRPAGVAAELGESAGEAVWAGAEVELQADPSRRRASRKPLANCFIASQVGLLHPLVGGEL